MSGVPLWLRTLCSELGAMIPSSASIGDSRAPGKLLRARGLRRARGRGAGGEGGGALEKSASIGSLVVGLHADGLPEATPFPGVENRNLLPYHRPETETPMALKRPKGPAGSLVVLEHTSRILKGNPLGDPHVRKLGVWLPPQYEWGGRRRFPALYDLVGFTGSGLAHANWKPFGANVPERAARLIREQKMGPAIIVFPDCFTALGGNQYVNSSAIGDYADYLTREIIP